MFQFDSCVICDDLKKKKKKKKKKILITMEQGSWPKNVKFREIIYSIPLYQNQNAIALFQ